MHPRIKQPQIKGYYTSQRELNRVDDKATKDRTVPAKEYGPRVTANPRKYNMVPDGMCLHGTKSDRSSTILIKRGMPQRHERAVIKHELNHIYDERKRNMR
jgi:hypothetical protein